MKDIDNKKLKEGDRVKVFLFVNPEAYELGTIKKSDSKYCDYCIEMDANSYFDLRVDAHPIKKI